MIIELDDNELDVWQRINRLPIVLCHRDYWVENLFYRNGNIRVVDWDTTGWGYLGEDIASLIADETAPGLMVSCYENCVPEYYRGFSEHVSTYSIRDNCVYELILIMFGYRLIEWFKFAKSAEEKDLQLSTMQKIYELRQLATRV
jgi:thiamine kinase-like enzyme